MPVRNRLGTPINYSNLTNVNFPAESNIGVANPDVINPDAESAVSIGSRGRRNHLEAQFDQAALRDHAQQVLDAGGQVSDEDKRVLNLGLANDELNGYTLDFSDPKHPHGKLTAAEQGMPLWAKIYMGYMIGGAAIATGGSVAGAFGGGAGAGAGAGASSAAAAPAIGAGTAAGTGIGAGTAAGTAAGTTAAVAPAVTHGFWSSIAPYLLQTGGQVLSAALQPTPYQERKPFTGDVSSQRLLEENNRRLGDLYSSLQGQPPVDLSHLVQPIDPSGRVPSPQRRPLLPTAPTLPATTSPTQSQSALALLRHAAMGG